MGEAVAYEGGRKLQAGWVSTDQIPLGIDTYYPGMLLAYKADSTVTPGTNTGDGTVTLVTADSGVVAGNWVLTMTAALVAKLEDPSGAFIAGGIALADGGAETVKVAGLSFTITDGATAFVAGDSFTIAVESAGEYVSTTDYSEVDAIYNGEEKTLASSGYGYAIVAGEINETGLVSSSNVALTLTEADRAAMRDCGFEVKRV